PDSRSARWRRRPVVPSAAGATRRSAVASERASPRLSERRPGRARRGAVTHAIVSTEPLAAHDPIGCSSDRYWSLSPSSSRSTRRIGSACGARTLPTCLPFGLQGPHAVVLRVVLDLGEPEGLEER